MRRFQCVRMKKDFDAWAYDVFWPDKSNELPLRGAIQLTVEDIKFAYNAWTLLRLSLFFGTTYPKVLSHLSHTTPSMDIAHGGNRLFYMYSRTGATLSKRRKKVALTPNHPRAKRLQSFDWTTATHTSEGVEIVLGMENGLSEKVIEQCDECVYIPQYGSIGSLSMMSALSIATHAAFRGYFKDREAWRMTSEFGHMPLSNNPNPVPGSLPHETELLHLSNEEIKVLLRERRSRYPLQLAVAMYNEFADRNISAVMRNGNAFNIEKMFLLNRRKHNRRGAVGTQKILDVIHCSAAIPSDALEEYEMWLLYPYYPYIQCYHFESPGADNNNNLSTTYLRPDSPELCSYLHTGHQITDQHPLCKLFPGLLRTPVLLDDNLSLLKAVQEVRAKGKRGILLAVAEEGSSPHQALASHCSRVAFVVNPDRLQLSVQRGLSPALSTAIAFERIRSAIDSLC